MVGRQQPHCSSQLLLSRNHIRCVTLPTRRHTSILVGLGPARNASFPTSHFATGMLLLLESRLSSLSACKDIGSRNSRLAPTQVGLFYETFPYVWDSIFIVPPKDYNPSFSHTSVQRRSNIISVNDKEARVYGERRQARRMWKASHYGGGTVRARMGASVTVPSEAWEPAMCVQQQVVKAI